MTATRALARRQPTPLTVLPAQLVPEPFGKAQLNQIAAAIARRGDSPNTRRNYATDLARFFRWLAVEGIAPHAATPDDLDRYRAWLIEPVGAEGAARYSVASANRSLVVVRLFYNEAQRRGWLWLNPAAWLRSVRGGSGEVAHPALTLAQLRELLAGLDREVASEEPHVHLSALRDRLVLHLGFRNGLRRAELSALRMRDVGEDGGHSVLIVRGKGRKQRKAKLQASTLRSLRAWAEAVELTPADPLFFQVAKGGHVIRQAISGEAIREIVRRRLAQIGITDPRYGAHSMRSSFITLALEGGAPLQKTQRAAGHADPRMTEAYDRRRDDLDDNASDYIRV
jgi:site-specific recombinase XerD